ncbi:MAG: CAP domain-containing protein, partial [Chloroflexota bacterium]
WALVLALGILSVFPRSVLAGAATQCVMGQGFKSLHDMAPAAVGECLDSQAFATNGDAQQHTTKGLLAWRKADNWTAFTNGYMTWINGPYGLQTRLNSARFPWEEQTGELSIMASEILGLINQDRLANGRPVLIPIPGLAAFAEGRTQDLLNAGGTLSHYDANGNLVVSSLLAGDSYQRVGENLAEAVGSPDQAVRAAYGLLMNDPPHRANILDPAFNEGAVAVAKGGPTGPYYFVQVFAEGGH